MQQGSIYKGSISHLQNILLKLTVYGTYKPEDSLKGYAEIHLNSKNGWFIDSGNSILLVLGTSLLFARDVLIEWKIENSNTTILYMKYLVWFNSILTIDMKYIL